MTVRTDRIFFSAPYVRMFCLPTACTERMACRVEKRGCREETATNWCHT